MSRIHTEIGLGATVPAFLLARMGGFERWECFLECGRLTLFGGRFLTIF